ncbi:hypothetical protein BJ508DRAFT_337011 [Ascobolus immersus RN42]|uniref:Uncharacterized protein n=1 Tax=Ascobolus immersus RN42 TaxID=1160509 RepID=A0A3N4H6Q5_ASCIM|nr:hypothetical protein BJ508DRAFT_337011 [Ascobolus immersus RN42]
MSPDNHSERDIHRRTNDSRAGHKGDYADERDARPQPQPIALDAESLAALTDAIIARIGDRLPKRAEETQSDAPQKEKEVPAPQTDAPQKETEDPASEEESEEETEMTEEKKKLSVRRDAIKAGRGFMDATLKEAIEKQVVNHIDALYALARNNKVDPAIVLAEAGFNEWYALSPEGPGTRKGISTPWTVFSKERSQDDDMKLPKTDNITERNKALAERQALLSKEYQKIKAENGQEYADLKAKAQKATDDKIDRYRDTLWDGSEAKEPLWSAVEARKLRDENIKRFHEDMANWVLLLDRQQCDVVCLFADRTDAVYRRQYATHMGEAFVSRFLTPLHVDAAGLDGYVRELSLEKLFVLLSDILAYGGEEGLRAFGTFSKAPRTDDLAC